LVLKGFLPISAYLHEDERYKKCFIGDWYLSGDLAKKMLTAIFGLSVEPMRIKNASRKRL
jgi:hypothetical protein